MATPVSAAELRKANKRHWLAVGKTRVSREALLAREKERKAHLEQLRNIQFMRRLLDPTKQKKIIIRTGGEMRQYTLLGVGLEMAKHHRSVVVVIDSPGRGILFYRSTGLNSGKPGKWLPFETRKIIKDKQGKEHEWFAKFKGHPNFPEEYVKLGE